MSSCQFMCFVVADRDRDLMNDRNEATSLVGIHILDRYLHTVVTV